MEKVEGGAVFDAWQPLAVCGAVRLGYTTNIGCVAYYSKFHTITSSTIPIPISVYNCPVHARE